MGNTRAVRISPPHWVDVANLRLLFPSGGSRLLTLEIKCVLKTSTKLLAPTTDQPMNILYYNIFDIRSGLLCGGLSRR